ncbi:MAG: CDP-alcohol phosphatidyltransferase family protein [Pseudomonadota bacterium]|nr:CDP-alcohol phosphatidyltransferase family protein [Pseudomonadota bacterium]
MLLLSWSNLPNAICVIRMILTVPIVIFLINFEYQLALLLVVIAGLSDALDGFLAKRFNWKSWLGAILDPMADKLMFISVFAALTWTGLVPDWLFFVVVGRDLVIVLGAIVYQVLIEPLEPRPSKVGKLNTITALIYLFSVIAYQIYGWPSSTIILISGAMVFVISLVSGLHYVLTWSRMALEFFRQEA